MVLVIELYFPRPVVYIHRSVLVVATGTGRCKRIACCVKVGGGVLENVFVVGFPFVVAHAEVEVVLVGEVVSIVEFGVHHTHIVVAACAAVH